MLQPAPSQPQRTELLPHKANRRYDRTHSPCSVGVPSYSLCCSSLRMHVAQPALLLKAIVRMCAGPFCRFAVCKGWRSPTGSGPQRTPSLTCGMCLALCRTAGTNAAHCTACKPVLASVAHGHLRLVIPVNCSLHGASMQRDVAILCPEGTHTRRWCRMQGRCLRHPVRAPTRRQLAPHKQVARTMHAKQSSVSKLNRCRRRSAPSPAQQIIQNHCR